MKVVEISHACRTCWGQGPYWSGTSETPPEYMPTSCADCDEEYTVTVVPATWTDENGELVEGCPETFRTFQADFVEWLRLNGIPLYDAGGDAEMRFTLRERLPTDKITYPNGWKAPAGWKP